MFPIPLGRTTEKQMELVVGRMIVVVWTMEGGWMMGQPALRSAVRTPPAPGSVPTNTLVWRDPIRRRSHLPHAPAASAPEPRSNQHRESTYR